MAKPRCSHLLASWDTVGARGRVRGRHPVRQVTVRQETLPLSRPGGVLALVDCAELPRTSDPGLRNFQESQAGPITFVVDALASQLRSPVLVGPGQRCILTAKKKP